MAVTPLMNLWRKILTLLPHTSSEISEGEKRRADLIVEQLGVFSYEEDGFTIRFETEVAKKVRWDQIESIVAYKVDLMTIDEIVMEITYSDRCITITEELAGWYKFVEKTKEVFPEIPKGWDWKIPFPAFATNLTLLYKKPKANATS